MSFEELWYLFIRTLRLSLVFAVLASVLIGEALPGDVQTDVQGLVGNLQFNFLTWTFDALGLKISQGSVSEQDYLAEPDRKQIVLDYMEIVQRIGQLRGEIRAIFTDPAQTDPATAAAADQAELDALLKQQADRQPLAEAVLQEQISQELAAQGFGVLGEILPPVSFHGTPLPSFLVVSRRDRIERIANAEIAPGLTAEDEAALEDRVDRTLDVSSLVVPLGGIGTYPTMLYETSDLGTILEIGSHEWCHNYLTLRPLGLSYEASGELRTMNETTCTLFGNEVGALTLAQFYPERVPPPPPAAIVAPETPATPPPPPAFDFNAEMRETRVQVDAWLAQGRIEAAETYMEQRRQVFLDHGYQIRKINQAYFAFYGAYADQPGAGGQDPVGPAVTALRARSASLKAFIDRISWMTTFEQLQKALESNP